MPCPKVLAIVKCLLENFRLPVSTFVSGNFRDVFSTKILEQILGKVIEVVNYSRLHVTDIFSYLALLFS